MTKRLTVLMATLIFNAMISNAHAWDHPGHMTTAAIAFAEIERARPELIEKIGLLFLAHPDTAPFWVSAGEAKGKERVRRMFMEMDWAYNIKTLPDPNRNLPAEKLVQNMVNFILNGVSPVKDAPPLPAGYWEKLQSTSERHITLAGYRIADLLIAAADNIEAQRKFIGR